MARAPWRRPLPTSQDRQASELLLAASRRARGSHAPSRRLRGPLPAAHDGCPQDALDACAMSPDCCSSHCVVLPAASGCSQDALDACATSPDCYISYDWNNELMYSFIYHFFGLLWTNQVRSPGVGTSLI